MKTNTGGPAFPQHPQQQFAALAGATLRDYFAAKAMQAWGPHITDGPCRMHEDAFKHVAVTAYQMADAMLAEREKTNDQ